ncbi:MAG: right-handed parallel beta-helix repeat-containing protein, partial [Planctomycetota bacterium]|nr:right-handed parallel beta-helix repeat-containing protein [Planctomycetota bacterium]
MNRITAVVAGLSLAFVGTSTTIAATINVPGDQPTIAAAISASVNGDVINIAAGTYNEHSLNPGGKAITIGSASGNLDVTIDAQQGGSVFVINSGEGSGTVIQNLVITGGSTPYGGGIKCESGSSPTITGCTIEGNASCSGGGIYCASNSDATINSCLIRNNTANGVDGQQGGQGGGIFCDEASPTIT